MAHTIGKQTVGTTRSAALTLQAVLAVAAAAALLALSLAAHSTPYFGIDLAAARAVQAIGADWFDGLMRFVGGPGYPPQVYIVIVIMLGVLWAFKLKWEAWAEVFAVVGIGVVGLIIKILVDRPRPTPDLIHVATVLDGGKQSFPAGHVESYVAIFGFLCYLSYRLLPKNSVSRVIELLVYGTMIALIGISRVYLGEHWFSDVVGGYLLGGIWLWLTVRLYEWGKTRLPAGFAASAQKHGNKGATPMANTSAGTKLQKAKQDVSDKAEQATRNPWVETFMRFGYLARGVLFVTVGILAIQLALGRPAASPDQNGALATIARQPFGQILLTVIVAGLIGYSLWGFVRAIVDPLGRGHDKEAIVERVGFAISGFSYGALVYPFLQFLSGSGGAETKSQTQATQDVTAQILAQPFGPWLIGLIGLLVIASSLVQLYVALTAKFQKDFESRKMDAGERKWMVLAGRIGIGARGLVFGLIGFFFVQAAINVDPKQAVGIDGALLKIAQQPEGMWLLIFAAAGLIIFGIYSMLGARWLRVT